MCTYNSKDQLIHQISEKLLLSVKRHDPTDALLTELENLQLYQIQNELKNDDSKKAFWINVYNSFCVIINLCIHTSSNILCWSYYEHRKKNHNQ